MRLVTAWLGPRVTNRYVAAAFFVLAGCATPQERAHYAIRQFGPFCQGLGFTPGTEAFANCIHQQVMADESQVQPYRPRTCVRSGVVTTCY